MPNTVEFTLTCNGVEKALADWGIDDLEYDWENLAPHFVTFTVAGRAIDASNIFPYGATVIIQQDRVGTAGAFSGGKRWFYGRVEPWDLVGGGGREDQIGRLVNPWWYLMQKGYKMVYTQTNNGVKTQFTTSRVVLGILFNQVTAQPMQINTGAQIIAALQWAISQGAPIQIGNIAPWGYPPTDFQRGISCAEVIQKMWRVESDFVVVWDYTTLPYPTIHCLKGSTANLDPSLSAGQKAALVLTPLNIDLNAANWLEKVHIKPRPDWQKSYVNIDYDQINTQGNSQYLALGNDHWPDPLPTDTESLFRGVDLYFDLAGSKVSSSSESTTITSAPFNITTLAQWQSWKPELASQNIASVGFAAVDSTHPAPALITQAAESAYNAANYCEVLDGNYHDWLANAPNNITAQKVRASAWITVVYKSAPGKKGHKVTKLVHYDFTAISLNTANVATTFTQTTNTVQAYAEAQPVGLPKVMYLAWQSLAVEGALTTLEKELASLVSFGNCLNFITPPRPEWATVNAVVQSITGSAIKGTTNVKFGAPLHLTAQQFIDFLRVARYRVPSVDIAFLFGGALATGGGTVRHPRKSHAHAAGHGAEELKVTAIYASQQPDIEADTTKQGSIILDPSVTSGTGPAVGITAQKILDADALNT
ncbi:MAG: hypothetical protein ABSH15_04250 [Verrucomicrobiota bacterium]|jgi:hypothetical protein